MDEDEGGVEGGVKDEVVVEDQDEIEDQIVDEVVDEIEISPRHLFHPISFPHKPCHHQSRRRSNRFHHTASGSFRIF